MGFIVYLDGSSYYYSGDTALTMDMQLIPHWASPKYAILPIGDNFTMGISDAILAANFCKAKKIIGVHFDTFGFIKIDHNEAIKAFEKEGLELTLPNIGAAIEL